MFLTHSQLYMVLLVLFTILQTTFCSDYYDQPDYNYGHEHYGHESELPAVETLEQNSTNADVELR